MSIWEAFGMGRHKGFSREAGLLLDEAVELAGSMGCARADTGHLLLAMLQIDRGPAGRFLAGKNITEPAVRRQLAEGRTSPARQLDRKALARGVPGRMNCPESWRHSRTASASCTPMEASSTPAAQSVSSSMAQSRCSGSALGRWAFCAPMRA